MNQEVHDVGAGRTRRNSVVVPRWLVAARPLSTLEPAAFWKYESPEWVGSAVERPLSATQLYFRFWPIAVRDGCRRPHNDPSWPDCGQVKSGRGPVY